MKTNYTPFLSALLALTIGSNAAPALAQDSQVTDGTVNTQATEAEALLQSIGNQENDQDLARLLQSEDYNFLSRIQDNWYVGLMVGAMNSWGSYDSEAGWFKRTNVAAALNIGKFLTPVNDVRLQLFYGRGTGVRGADNVWDSSYPYDQAHENALADNHTYHWNTVGIAAQWLPNLTNLFMGYKPERRFSVSAMVGIGLEHTWSYSEKELSYVSVWAEHKQSATPRNLVALQFGVQADFRLSHRWHLQAEVTDNFLDDSYDGLISNQKWDGHLNMLVGLNYYLPSKSDKNRENSPFYDKYLKAADQIGRNRDALDDALANRQTVVDSKDVTKNVTYTLISFDEKKIEVPRLQQNNVYQTAEAYKRTADSKIFITNSSKVDDGKFHQRAWSISKLLNERWQIPLEDIWIDADEDHIQKLQIPDVKNYIIFIINEE